MNGLLVRVSQTYHFLMANETLSAIDIMKETLAQIAQVVQGCAQFITNYSEVKNFCRCLCIPVYNSTQRLVQGRDLERIFAWSGTRLLHTTQLLWTA